MTGPFQGGPDPPKVSAILVSHNTRDDLLRCLASLAAHVHLPLEVVVVDNASADGSVEAVRWAYPTARVLESPANRGFSTANNAGIRASAGPQVLVLNSDAQLTAGAVETMSGLLVLGVRARRPEALGEAERRASREHEPDWVSGSCFLARRVALEAVGGFDEGFFLYEEDADLCRRLRGAGWRVLYTPAAEVRHVLGRSAAQAPARARQEYRRSHLRYYRKHNGPLLTALLRAYLAVTGGLGG